MKKTIYSLMLLSLFLLNMPFSAVPAASADVVVDETKCYELGDIPDGEQYASDWVSYEQGTQKGGSAVADARSNPDNALVFESGQDENNFFSLGFGGWIIVTFDYPIFNGPGVDLKITEDTWGLPYPLETADIYVSQTGADDDWHLVGTADNTDLVIDQTISEFELPDGMLWANYVKVVDTTNPTPHNNQGDGFDLNAVEALYSGVETLCDYDYQCSDGILYQDMDSAGSLSKLYLIDPATGNAELKQEYSGDFRNTLAADSDGNVYAIDRSTSKLMELMPDGTTVEVAQTDLLKSEGTLAIAPDDRMYIALNDNKLYEIDRTTGAATELADLTGDGVDVQGGDIVIDTNNLMTIVNTSGQVWTVDLADSLKVEYLGDFGSGTFTGMAMFEDNFYVTERDNDNLHEFTYGNDSFTITGALNVNTEQGDAASCAAPRLTAGLEIDKSAKDFVADPFEVYGDEEVTYTYAVSNTGDLPLINVVVSDDKCEPVTYVDGDENQNDKLDTDEVWNYECTTGFEQVGSVINTGTATADDPFGDEVNGEDTFTTVVKTWGCTLTQGYWKTHSTYGPAAHPDEVWADYADTYFYDSGQTYYEALWNAPKGGNAYYILAHQYIAAFLNSQTAYVPEEVQTAMDEAKVLFEEYGPDDIGALKGKNGKELRSQFIDLAGTLGDYNEGLAGVPHCSDIELLETIIVDSNGDVAESNTVLTSEKDYLLRASGTFYYNNANDWADAEWYLMNGNIVKGDDEGSVPYVLDVSINGYSENIDWGPYQETHVYEKVFNGPGGPISFSIYDSNHSDNTGSLTVEIYKID